MDAHSDYLFGTQRIHHLFRNSCRIKSLGRGADGGEIFAVLVSCRDNVTDAELAVLPIMYVDVRNDDFQSPPEETR